MPGEVVFRHSETAVSAAFSSRLSWRARQSPGRNLRQSWNRNPGKRRSQSVRVTDHVGKIVKLKQCKPI